MSNKSAKAAPLVVPSVKKPTKAAKASGNRTQMKLARSAEIFAALGDETRLSLLARLGEGQGASIQQLTDGGVLTRQAITKHLRVLESAGLVRCRRNGRESDFTLLPHALDQAQAYLGAVSAHWDAALLRLKHYVEETNSR